MSTKIDWCDEVWNPTTGCTKGCSYCYARAFAERMAKNPNAKIAHKYHNGFSPACHEESLLIPLKWKKPRRVFVDSMGDLFDPFIPDEFIYRVLSIIDYNRQHTFMILTKRPDRMRSLINNHWQYSVPRTLNMWLGVSVTNQAEASELIPHLLKTTAEKRFVSIEPMRGPVDLLNLSGPGNCYYQCLSPITGSGDGNRPALDWVICGLMSGKLKDLQTCCYDDVISLRDQCGTANVPFYFKGWGSIRPGAQLDGREYREFPV